MPLVELAIGAVCGLVGAIGIDTGIVTNEDLSVVMDFIRRAMKFITRAVNFIIAVWGIRLWANMTKDCEHYYTWEYPSLLLVFNICMVLQICRYCIFLIPRCIATLAGVVCFACPCAVGSVQVVRSAFS